MLQNWKETEIVEAWSRSVGEFGDVFQMTITNPFVLSAISALSNDDTFDPERGFSDCVRQQREYVGGDYSRESLNRWHLTKLASAVKQQRQLRVLDLGGGEAYIGRWLAAAGVRYWCVDGSTGLLNTGAERAKNSDLEFHNFDFAALPDTWEPFPAFIEGLSDDPPDLVLCLSVLDHLEHPELLMSSMAGWLGNDARYQPRPFLCVTLNPDFFFGPAQSPSEKHVGGPKTARLGPARKNVLIYPRSWQRYERMFVRQGYHVRWCHPSLINPIPAELHKLYKYDADLEHIPGAGPFVLWVLIPDRRGQLVAPDHLPGSQLVSLGELSEAHWQLLRRGGVRRKTYAPDEIVLYSHNLSCGIHVIEDGTLLLKRFGLERQTFKKGEFIGELESSDDFFVGRYIYQVHAGKEGATVLHVPAPTLRGLLDMSSNEFSARLFLKLRDRVATHSWVYHKSSGSYEQKCQGPTSAAYGHQGAWNTRPERSSSRPLVRATRKLGLPGSPS